MKAMILAAGLGTRLRPLTNDRPKALVEVGGRTMLEIAIARLRAFGVTEIVVNVHHYADMVIEYLKSQDNFGLRIEISREDILLDTGGGLKQAAWFFLESSDVRDEPFILHNVDVISTIDLAQMVTSHKRSGALATLAVQNRDTSRYLLFNEKGELCGRSYGRNGAPEMVRPATEAKPLAFAGIHVISPRQLTQMTEQGAFSIITTYLRLAGEGQKIQAFDASQFDWFDLGKPQSVAEAEKYLSQA